ncbi:MAG: type II secretion system F family protein [Comamonas sp.]
MTTALPPAALALGALACVLLALGLWLLARANRQKAEKVIHASLQRGLDIQRDLQAGGQSFTMPGTAPLMPQAMAQQPAAHPVQVWLDNYLGYGAWGISPRVQAVMCVTGLALALLGALRGGWLMGLALLVVYLLLCAFAIWLRLGKRREKMLAQLPGFLDNMVRLISIGNSPHAAFQLAFPNVPDPLGEALRQAAGSLQVSSDLGQAMAQLERTWGMKEFGLLAAVFRMSTRYGGRADLVLERVSAYLRDRQSAERELHALSTEVRLSAWILALLPIVVGSLIVFLNEGYLMRMWHDSTGRILMFVAAGLQAAGSFMLYRLARLK